MKKRNITLCAVAMLCMQGYAKADTFTLKGDNTCVENYAQMTAAYKSNRPKMKKRLFTSKAVEAEILRVKKLLTNPKLAWMFENCFPNTLDTTVHFRMLDGKPDTFVYTGDIHAMWLRDSGAQVWPYVQLANNDAQLKEMLEGVIRRQFLCINIDPYANAFNDGPTGGNWMTDLTDMKPELHERKWEIDSLCYPLRLAYQYWKVTGDSSIFDGEWMKAITAILKTFKEQQRKDGVGPYRFQRKTERALDTLNNDGLGAPVKPVGLIVSAFRPSDDATTLQYLVPSNFFAVSSLRKAAEILTEVNKETSLAKECTDLAAEVEAALKKYATYNHPEFGTIYAFEVDGFGNHLLMDDANVPSLLAMPYLGDVDVLASPLRPVSALIRLDLPTLERPAKAISSIWSSGGSWFKEATPSTKVQAAPGSLRPAASSSESYCGLRFSIGYFPSFFLAIAFCWMIERMLESVQ